MVLSRINQWQSMGIPKGRVQGIFICILFIPVNKFNTTATHFSITANITGPKNTKGLSTIVCLHGWAGDLWIRTSPRITADLDL